MKQLKQKIRTRLLVTGSILLAATLMMGVSTTAFAQPMANIDSFVYSGTGCPAGSAQAAVINGGKTLRVEFQAFKVSMNGLIGTQSVECEISVFLSAPPNRQLEISPADYIGSYSARAKITLNAGHFWANKQAGPWAGGTAGTGAAGAFRLKNPNKTLYGLCGGRNELKDDGAKGIKLSIKPADMVSADVKFAEYTLNYMPCEGRGGGSGSGGGEKGPAG